MTELAAHDLARSAAQPAAPTWMQRQARRIVLSRLATIRRGELTVREGAEVQRLGAAEPDGLHAEIVVRDPAFWSAIVAGGSVGAGEAWIDRTWHSPDLAGVVRLLLRNREVLDGMEGGFARLVTPLRKLFHVRNANTRDGSRRNIAAHYDLGNDFFELFLDDTMTYSCGVFERPEATLREASIAKIDRLCAKLELTPDDHLVEIGTGWGALAIHAAREYGCRVTTTTISRAQHEVAARRIAEAGLEDRITLLLEDYRDLQGQYDKLVSVEMIEAVGHQFLDTYVRRCCELLRPDGRMALQAITIADQHYARALKEVDFIKRHVFPGCFIPSTTAILDAATRATDLRLVHLEDIGPHYARTLATWCDNMHANADAIRAAGYDDRLLRLWEFYLRYCEGGFAERFLGNVQMVLARPESRHEPLLPPLGASPGS